jgi:bifunctional enzyme CysN/CysC
LTATGMPVAAPAAGDLLPGELLRFVTAGSVDDGKSTLIGRLLFDARQIFEDQLAWIARASEDRGGDGTLDLALLTDGLRDERAQGITIDVAYRYFATAHRRFVIADAPGHVAYTRNMVTGASTADLALILIDARRAVTSQARRHALIVSLLGVPHLVVCVNKMDLVGYDAAAFERIVAEFTGFATRLEIQDVTFIPICALHGDNVVERSAAMPWYRGSPLLYHLEHVHIASDRNLIDARFPVQCVIREPQREFRGYAGRMASGVLRRDDDVVVLPSGQRTRISAIHTFDGEVGEAYPPVAVTLTLADPVAVGRGDLLCRPDNRPTVAHTIDARVCWMGDRSLTPGGRFVMQHTTRSVRAHVDTIHYEIDVETLHRRPASELQRNDIGRVRLRVPDAVFADPYRRSRSTGSFVLIDPATNETVGGGMVEDAEP